MAASKASGRIANPFEAVSHLADVTTDPLQDLLIERADAVMG
jgi:hypothetical protein